MTPILAKFLDGSRFLRLGISEDDLCCIGGDLFNTVLCKQITEEMDTGRAREEWTHAGFIRVLEQARAFAKSKNTR